MHVLVDVLLRSQYSEGGWERPLQRRGYKIRAWTVMYLPLHWAAHCRLHPQAIQLLHDPTHPAYMPGSVSEKARMIELGIDEGKYVVG